MTTFPRKSRRSVLYRNLPGQLMIQDFNSWRTTRLLGDAPTNVSQTLRKEIAGVITRTQFLKMQSSSGTQNPRLQQLAQKYGKTGPSSLVAADQVRLIIPDSMKVEPFPLGLNCYNCNYFEIPDSRNDNSPCPNCNNGTLRQLKMSFECPQCGNKEEVSPMAKKIKGLSTFACPEKDHKCGGAVIQLNTRKVMFSNWEWICSKTKKKEMVMKFCRDCKARTGTATKMSLLNPRSSQSRALSMSFLSFGSQQSQEPTSPEWSVNQFIPDQKREKLFLSFGITNIEKFTEIESSNVTFGTITYQGNIPKLFSNYNQRSAKYEFDAYVTQNEGKGILIKFDKKKLAKCVLEHVSKKDPNNALNTDISSYLSELENCAEARTEEIYNWVCKKSIETFDDPDSPFKQLFAVLHTFEHALSKHASLITGLDSQTFTGTVMMSLGAVLIYENKDVSAGGIDYLINEKRLYKWIFDSRRQIVNCENYCKEGCGMCVYCYDPLCHPVWSKELEKTYVLPNSLLARDLTEQFIDL